MFSAELLMKALGISPDMFEKYATGILKGVEEIRAGIAALINSNAAIVARLEAIEAKIVAQETRAIESRLNTQEENKQ